jgi:hypothetical protein
VEISIGGKYARKTSNVNYTTSIFWSSPHTTCHIIISVKQLCVLARKLPSPLIGNAKGGTRQAKTAAVSIPPEIAAIKTQLKLVNKCNHGLVELAKAKWYKGVCSKIHEMNMDPRLAWENI